MTVSVQDGRQKMVHKKITVFDVQSQLRYQPRQLYLLKTRLPYWDQDFKFLKGAGATALERDGYTLKGFKDVYLLPRPDSGFRISKSSELTRGRGDETNLLTPDVFALQQTKL